MAISDDAKAKIKNILLQHGETLTGDVVEGVFEIIHVVVEDTENKIDDAFLPVIDALKDVILGFVDEIYKEGEAEA